MNYFIGFALTIYIAWFIRNFDEPTYEGDITTAYGIKKDKDYKNMYNWLLFNYYYTFFTLFMVLVVSCIYRGMNVKAQARGHQIAHSNEKSKVEETELVQRGVAIN